MFYYRINGTLCCSLNGELDFPKEELYGRGTDEKEAREKAAGEEELVFLFERSPKNCRASFRVTDPALLYQDREDVSWLNKNALGEGMRDEIVDSFIQEGKMRAVNLKHPRFQEILSEKPEKKKKRVHVLAIGDVGSTLLTGLHLLGGDVISSIGICDISDKVTARWEFEENQIAYPWDYDALPEVDVVKPEELFQCDVFVFVASKGIPPVGSEVKDVRMYQFENNSKIVAQYARQAREEKFRGLFAVVSDPVDPLAKAAYLASNTDENGVFDQKGLRPEQIQGYGLGVMNARAAYYAKRDERFKQFLTEGRSFGPHGQDLVVADSIEHYNDELSKELTQLTVTANLHMRAIGFKPFIAPAYSSGAISLILTLRGEWHCGSVFLGGIFMGVKNRYTSHGLETEILPLPDALYERIVTAQENLKAIN